MLKEKILRLLKEEGGFFSGQKLAERLQVSRTAVWKAIARLKEEGYGIEGVQNLGYRLSSEDVLNESELVHLLEARSIPLDVIYCSSIDSTNRLAKELAERGETRELLIVSEEQTGGRGRRGRGWISPPEGGIWMSLLLFPSMESEKISMVTLLAALAVCEGIRASTGLEGTIKWPNDILLSGKKVSGILTEGSLDIDGIKYIVCGIGINANLAALDKSIEKTATSILLEAKTPCNRKDVIGSVLTGFLTYYRKFLEEKNLEFIRSKYEKHLITKNREVYIDGPKGGFFAMAQGIDEEGALVVTDEKGDRRRIVSGEVSIRGLCGYAE